MRTLLRGFTWIAAVAIVLLLLQVPAANAHPLGNFTINHYAGLQVTQDRVGVDYVLDMAEIPAFQEINRLDINRDRKAEPAETLNYPVEKCQEINSQLDLRINHQPLALALNRSTVEFPPGVGGLETLRLTCKLEGKLAVVDTNQFIEFEDNSYSQRLGWREITVNTGDIPVQGSFTTVSITKRLTEYPDDLLNSPLNQRQISFQINPSSPMQSKENLVEQSGDQLVVKSPIQSGSLSSQTFIGRSNDAFTSLIKLKELDFPTVLLALVIAFVWGGLHALSPGHGKTVVGAYLVGARSKVQHALLLGLTVTLTHTTGIFVLGLVMLGTSQFILTEQVFPWLSALSGILIIAIGLKLLASRLHNIQIFQDWVQKLYSATSAHYALEPFRPYDHHHDHQHHHHGDDHHSHHDHHHDHNHGEHSHSHLPPGADGSPITWSSILALGISGGILPCPSALVVLLSAISIGRIGFGLALVAAFSLGLAVVLTGIGLMLVFTKHWFERLPLQAPNSKLLPAFSALLITLIGIGITTQALFVPTL